MLTITLDTWIVGDTHFGHTNIIRYCNRPVDCDERMLSAWERLVGPDEDILHLGDLILAGRGNPGIYDRVKALPGVKYLVRGNHDRHGKTWFAALGFEAIPSPVVRLHGWPPILLSHRPQLRTVSIMRSIGINIHAHIHDKKLDAPCWRQPDVRYINACVEQTDYQPVRLWRLLQQGTGNA